MDGNHAANGYGERAFPNHNLTHTLHHTLHSLIRQDISKTRDSSMRHGMLSKSSNQTSETKDTWLQTDKVLPFGARYSRALKQFRTRGINPRPR